MDLKIGLQMEKAKEIESDSRKNESVKIVTLGCRLNTYESEVMKEATQNIKENLIIVNTCAVTKEAERQGRQTIRKLKKENPDYKIIVTGCSAQINPDMYAQMPEVSKVVGNSEKHKSESFIIDDNKLLVNNIFDIGETALHLRSGFDDKHRIFLQVQNGCNHRCTFCIIPYGRGNSRSVKIQDAVDSIKRFIDNGVKEVVLTGVDLTAYGDDIGTNLPELISEILKTDLKRLRISSVDPIELYNFGDEFFDLMTDERFMPHLHLSIQSGNTLILKRMKRRHIRDDIFKLIEKLQGKYVLGADLIAGFPTETDEFFADTLDIIKSCPIVYSHIFPFSARDGTPAARMPQLEKKLVKERAKILRDEAKLQLERYLKSCIGSKFSVLAEDNNKGHTETFAPVIINSNPGEIFDIKVTGFYDGNLVGERI
jgi:threonylcarbamoyladenosine tRNA methylthiotransferase MtaB